MAKRVELYFDGVKKACRQEEDRNGEFLFVADDGQFVKFPKDGDLEEMISAYNEANSKEVEHVSDVTYGKVETNK